MVNVLDANGQLLARCTPLVARQQLAAGHARPTDHPQAIQALLPEPITIRRHGGRRP